MFCQASPDYFTQVENDSFEKMHFRGWIEIFANSGQYFHSINRILFRSAFQRKTNEQKENNIFSTRTPDQ